MRKLLRANLFRLLRNRTLLLSCAAMLLAGVGLPLSNYLSSVSDGERWAPDSTVFAFAFLAPLLLALVTALFVGSEYSDGTMRNKLIVGHKRRCIYLSNLIVCIAAGLALCAAYLLPHTALSMLLPEEYEAAAETVLAYTALNFALVAPFAALYVLIAMLCQNKAYSTAGCLLLVFALLFAGIRIVSALDEPEYYSGYSYTENGVTVAEEPERNSNYLRGTKRQVYEFLHDFLPGDQAIQLSGMQAEKPAMLAVYDGIILLAATGLGLALFRRRDLK